MRKIQDLTLVFLLLLSRVAAAQQTTPPARPEPSPEKVEYSDYLGGVFALEGGGGFATDDRHGTVWFAGLKCGLPVSLKRDPPPRLLRTATLDLGYDRKQSQGGFSAEVSIMLPLVRFPTPRTDQANYIRIYGEPGLGYRFGGGNFGGYLGAKIMLAVFSHNRLTLTDAPPSPFVEIQHRFPFAAFGAGDTRIVFGVMTAWCNHCGLD